MKLETRQNEAMRREIGYRLGVLLAREQKSTPGRLLQLIRQLSDKDQGPVDENAFRARASVEETETWLRTLFVQQAQHLRELLQDEASRYERDELERLLAKINETLNGELGSPARK